MQRDPLTWGPEDVRFFLNPIKRYYFNKGIEPEEELYVQLDAINEAIRYLREQDTLTMGRTFPSLLHRYHYVLNNPINLIDPWGFTSWYVDINITAGYGAGGTGGVLINSGGVSPYIGGGLVTPGVSGSITWSPSYPTPGWTIGAQGAYGIAGQYGYSFGKGGGQFVEVGVGWPPGFSGTGYRVFGPRKWPWRNNRR